METGTGKTYVYLRTILELNQKYGLKKFIILVPSVAIREGVLKTLEQTKNHFRELYNAGFGYFAYNSAKLSKVREFSQSLDIQIMIMTIQFFNSDDRVMRQTPDRFNGESPINLVAETRPVVIMDEPQNMESELSKAAIADLKPLFKLRYSATHKELHNLMYRLTPVDAYKNHLVKKIQVFGVKDYNPNKRATKGNSEKMDKDAYDLIIKDKERLLSFAEPVCFIFSHSALKEGWDNPNIFQICTLRETNSLMKKWQEIGRGLRLPVDINGDRI